MPNERLTLEIALQAIGEDGVERLTSAINRLSASAESSGNRIGGAFQGAGRSVEKHFVPQVAAASGAIREFEGNLPIRAVERFITTTLGLGSVLQNAFPIVGGIAFGGMIFETLRKVDPLIEAEKRLAEVNKQVDTSFAELGKRLESLNIEEMAARFGKAAGSALAAFYSETSLKEDEARVRYLSDLIDRTKKKIAQDSVDSRLSGNPLIDLNPLITGQKLGAAGLRIGGWEIYGGTIAAQQKDLQRYQAELDETQMRVTVAGQEKSTELAKAAKEEKEDAKHRAEQVKAERSREQEMLRSGMDETLGNLKRDHEVTNAEETSFWEKRLAEVNQFGDRYLQLHKEIIVKLGDLAHTRNESNKRVAAEFDNLSREGFDRITKQQDESDRRGQEFVVSDATGNSRALDLVSRGRLDAQLARLDLQRAAVQRQTGLASQPDSSAAKIAESVRLREIDRQEGQLRLNEEAKLLNEIAATDTEKRQEQANRVVELARRTNQQVYDDTTRTLDLIHQYQERQLESFRGEIGSVFDALTSRNPQALRDLIRSQVLGIGRTITENLAQQYIWPEVQKATAGMHASGTLGKILQGTPFGPDPLQAATNANTQATLDNTAAILHMSGVASSGGGTGSGGTGLSIPGIPGFGGGTSTNGISGLLGGLGGLFGFGGSSSATSGLGDLGDGLPMASGPWGATSEIGGVGKLGGSEIGLSSIVGGGLGLLTAFNGFKKGGAGGALQGTSGILGTAAMFDPEPISKGILAAASIVTGLIGGFINGPQARENAINKAISQNQYIAPQALNATMSSSGTFADFGYKGDLRTSSFSPYPQVRQGYVWEQTHGLFGGPPTFYNVPGGETGQFGSPVHTPAPTVINITAMDSQDVARALMRAPHAVANAAATAMQNGHGLLTSEVQRAARF